MTYTQAAAQLNIAILPAFTRTVLTAILATFNSNFDSLVDSNGYPTNDGVNTLVPLVGSWSDPAIKTNTYIATKYILDECRLTLGLPVPPTINPY